MQSLIGERIEELPSYEGRLARVVLIEENGDKWEVYCLCRHDGTTTITEIDGAGGLTYLNDRYGNKVVWQAAREAVIRVGG